MFDLQSLIVVVESAYLDIIAYLHVHSNVHAAIIFFILPLSIKLDYKELHFTSGYSLLVLLPRYPYMDRLGFNHNYCLFRVNLLGKQ